MASGGEAAVAGSGEVREEREIETQNAREDGSGAGKASDDANLMTMFVMLNEELKKMNEGMEKFKNDMEEKMRDKRQEEESMREFIAAQKAQIPLTESAEKNPEGRKKEEKNQEEMVTAVEMESERHCFPQDWKEILQAKREAERQGRVGKKQEDVRTKILKD